MKLELTEEQERMRIRGLRILARIIVRHRLAHPELYVNGAAGDESPIGSDGVVDEENGDGEERT